MAVARQVQARGLQVAVKATEMIRHAQGAFSLLVGGTSPNHDVVSYLPGAFTRSHRSPSSDASSMRISGSGIAVTAGMLGLTTCQRDILERRSVSATARERGVVEGSDALVVFGSEGQAAVTLHGLGFAKVRERSALICDSFYKVVNATNGHQATAWARVERWPQEDSVCVHISLRAE